MSTNTVPAIFNFKEHPVRVLQRGDEFWFVAKDACEALALNNHNVYVARLLEREKLGVTICDPHGREQTTTFISESAVYKLAFRSNKKEAEEFTDWVASEVLPSIRKTGSYSISQQAQPLQGDIHADANDPVRRRHMLHALKLIEDGHEELDSLFYPHQRKDHSVSADKKVSNDQQKQIPEQSSLHLQSEIVRHLRRHGDMTVKKLKGSWIKKPSIRELEEACDLLVAAGIVHKYYTAHAQDGKYGLTRSVQEGA